MLKLTITFIAGALAFASVPAFAVDLPDYGSKNFNPSGDTPTYFTNESAPVAARTADTSERDWSAVDAIAPAEPTRSAHRSGGGRGKYHATHGVGRYGAGRSSGTAHSPHFVGARSSVGAVGHRPTSGSHASKRGKSGAWHAGAAEADPAMVVRG